MFNHSKNLPPIVLWDRGGRACQIQGIVIIASSIANVIHRVSLAGVDMIRWESKFAGSELLRSFYKGSAEASFDMELDVAVEQPDTYLCQSFRAFQVFRFTDLGYRL